MDMTGGGVNAVMDIDSSENSKCPCKSALMQYESYKKLTDGGKEKLASGSFSVLGKSTIEIPLAIQKTIIHKKIPVDVSFSCY